MTEVPPTGLDDAITPSRVALDERVPDAASCLERLLELAARDGAVRDPDRAFEAVLERERAAPTGMGEGVAIPHAKTDAVDRPVAAVVRCVEPVDFGAGGATLVVLLLAPIDGDDAHLDALATVSRALARPSVRERLAETSSEGAVCAALAEGSP